MAKKSRTIPRDLTNMDLEKIAKKGLLSFWETVKTEIPQVTRGDLSPLATIALEQVSIAAVMEWYNNNVMDLI